jgi:hypothetical protein
MELKLFGFVWECIKFLPILLDEILTDLKVQKCKENDKNNVVTTDTGTHCECDGVTVKCP